MTEIQLYIISILASVIVWAGKAYAKRYGKDIPNAVLSIGVFIISLGLSVAWTSGEILPPLPVCTADDPGGCATGYLAYASALIQAVGGYVAFAMVLYQALLKAVLERYIPSLLKRARMRINKG